MESVAVTADMCVTPMYICVHIMTLFVCASVSALQGFNESITQLSGRRARFFSHIKVEAIAASDRQ